MSTFTVSRFATVCAALGLLLIAGSARAQGDECVVPTSVPNEVLDTILDQASFDFGEVSEKACSGIVKDGVKACKAQVKGADKCWTRIFDMIYSISVKQCQEFATSELRAGCKAEAKGVRDSDKADMVFVKEVALTDCETTFAEDLSDACLTPIKM
jgi:hypothetical protein